IGVVVAPLLDLQVRKLRIPRYIAAVVTLFICLVVLFILFLFIQLAVLSIFSTVGSAGDTSDRQQQSEPFITQYIESTTVFIERAVDALEQHGIKINVSEITSEMQKRIPNFLQGLFGKFFNFVTSAFLVMIFVIFIVIGRDPYAKKPKLYAEIEADVRRYLVIKTAVSITTGICVWLILRLLGLQLAEVFGVLAFILNFIPSIGSIIATFLPLPVAVMQYESGWMVLLVIILPGIVQNVIGSIIEPKLLGKTMKIHPLTVLLALSFWGLLWGGVGMILAVPITSVIRIILSRFGTLKPVAMLLAGNLPEPPEE
ncbi:MAG: AI-2E family transporter, partial [Phycisphaerae bacterium]